MHEENVERHLVARLHGALDCGRGVLGQAINARPVGQEQMRRAVHVEQVAVG